MANYTIERDGQIDFFDNYGIPYEDDASILVDNTDGVYNGNILEFKLSISNLNKVLLQAIKYLSRMRVKGESIPAAIILVDLNAKKAYEYKSEDYRNDIQKVYIGASSKDNSGFVGGNPINIYDYSDMAQSNNLKKLLKNKKNTIADMYMPIDIDESCIVGWAERYYRELPKASKGDFIGDDTGASVKVTGEIREPRHFEGLIRPYTGKSNEKFKYLMDCLNDRLSKKDLGAFYTPEPYARKAAELVEMAVKRALDAGKRDYIILDRCAGTGNLESALIGLCDKNGGDLISHCVVSTYEYYEYKVLNERIGDKVREIIPPTEADVVYENGKVSNADAMSEDFINNPIIKAYVDNKDCAIILFENPPYRDVTSNSTGKGKKNEDYVVSQMKAELSGALLNELTNRFIWSAFKYYQRQNTDSYILFSPVKYFKTCFLVDKTYAGGYLFNRLYFHATPSAISCIYWQNINATYDSITLPCYDIDEKGIVLKGLNIQVKKCYRNFSSTFYDKRKFTTDTEDGICCNLDGTEFRGNNARIRVRKIYNTNAIAYIRASSYNFDVLSKQLLRCGEYDANGFFVRQDSYLNMLCLWCAKMIPLDSWYERDIYATTSDGGDVYTKDSDFLKSCLIYTCLSNQNKCLTFEGSDGRHYQNELCFDTNTLASNDLATMKLDTDEQALIDLWNTILAETKATGKCNPVWTYGVYQITKEINTSHKEGSGKNVRIVYDYPSLNGNLDTLRTRLKEYYKSHITAKMFKYELLK